MPKSDTLQKGFIDDPDNLPETRISMAKNLIRTITAMYPDMSYYIGIISIDTKEFKRFLEYCPPHHDIVEYVFDSLLQEDHRPPTSRKIDYRYDYYKRRHDLRQFVTVYRAETEAELRMAEKKITAEFFNKDPHCKNRTPGGSGPVESPFHHGYVYFAYSGKPVNPYWLEDTVVSIANRYRSRSIDQRGYVHDIHVSCSSRPFWQVGI